MGEAVPEQDPHGLVVLRPAEKGGWEGKCRCGQAFFGEESIHARDLVEAAHRRHLKQEEQIAQQLPVSGALFV